MTLTTRLVLARQVLSFAGGCCFIVGCGEPLKDGQSLEEPRVLGARVEGNGLTSTPGAGEDASLTLLLAGPEGPFEARVAYAICEAADSARGVPYCLGDVLLEGELEKSTATPKFDFRVPGDAAPGTRFALLAVACVEGAPVLAADPLDWGCEGSASELRLSFDFWTASSAVKGTNPDLDGMAGEVDDVALTFDDPRDAPSCGAGVAAVGVGKTYQIRIDLGENVDWGGEAGSVLQVSHFSSDGRYERRFSILTPDESTVVELEWEAPSEPSASKHYLVVRDGLGGVTWRSFSVCAQSASTN